MRALNKRNKILVIVIGILIVLSLNFFQKTVKGFFYSISSPIQKSFWRTGDGLSDFFEAITETRSIKKENEELKTKIQELFLENSSLKELKKENEVLREALGVGLPEEFRLALAEVVGKDLNQDAILINLGSKDGLSEDMPVITRERVLLGKIVEVYDGFSRVMLISDKNSSFDAEISDSDISGVVKGRGDFQLILDFVPQSEEVKEGDLVISRALGGIYPKGLLVGLVKEAKKSDIKSFQQIEISPFFVLEELENIFVILNF